MTKLNLLAGLGLALLLTPDANAVAPLTFNEAKRLLREQVYHDANQGGLGTLYCGCSWEWTGVSAGVIDLERCGYQPGPLPSRAARLEYELVVDPALLAKGRACWNEGGRVSCQRTDPEYSRMEADPHNILMVVGEANALRGSRPLLAAGANGGRPIAEGCATVIAADGSSVTPRDEAKGIVARTTLYMAHRYQLDIGQEALRDMQEWDRQFPVSAFELERDRRISQIVGNGNPFVARAAAAAALSPVVSPPGITDSEDQADDLEKPVLIFGNVRSGAYHLPDCPGHSKIPDSLRVVFSSEAQARRAGYRRAAGCS